MNPFKKLLAIAFWSTMVCPVAARAMDFPTFDKMSEADQAEYIADLVKGAQDVLKADGRVDLADKVHQLFTIKLGTDQTSAGMAQFMMNLARVRVVDADRIVKDPNSRRLDVELAMVATLQKNGIVLPKSFMTVNNGFVPKHPPQSQTAGSAR